MKGKEQKQNTDKAMGYRRASRKIAIIAIFTAVGLIMFMIEGLFPPFFIPGAKAGLSNVPSFFLLYALDFKCALAVLVIRVILGSTLTGSLSSLMYSLPAGVAALIAAALIKRFVKCTPLCTSTTSAVIHNLVQNAVFIIISETPEAAVYFPYLALIGALAGLVVGATVTLMLNSRAMERALPFGNIGKNTSD